MSNSRLLLAIVTLCSACGGSSFEAGGSGGASQAGATGSNGGNTSSAGTSSGGSAGDSSAGASTGGHPAGGAGTAGAGGSSAGGSSAGASSAGAGGSSGGATAGAGGSAGAADCATLKTDYAAALEKARVCDKASTMQCSTSSTLPSTGCGCPVLVNSKSEATTLAKAKYQAIQDAKCPTGPICNIACIAYTGAMCSAQMGPGNIFMCTGSSGVATP